MIKVRINILKNLQLIKLKILKKKKSKKKKTPKKKMLMIKTMKNIVK